MDASPRPFGVAGWGLYRNEGKAMYANLSVKVGADEHYAWRVDIDGERGELTVHVDGNDGDGSYAVPAGEVKVDLRTGPPVSITADF